MRSPESKKIPHGKFSVSEWVNEWISVCEREREHDEKLKIIELQIRISLSCDKLNLFKNN